MIPKLDKDSTSNEKYKLKYDMNLKYKSLQQNISKFNSAILKKIYQAGYIPKYKVDSTAENQSL